MRHRCLYKPRAMQPALMFSHIVAVGIYLGATVLLGVAIETVGRRATDASARRQQFAELFSAYNPLAIAVLGVVVMSGAWSLTPYKAALGAGYYAQVGSILVGKLSLAFKRLRVAIWLTVALTLITIWFALGMHAPVPVGLGD